jgi:hypothetical protein
LERGNVPRAGPTAERAAQTGWVTDRRSPIPDLTATSEFTGNAVFDLDHQTNENQCSESVGVPSYCADIALTVYRLLCAILK